MKVTIVKDYIFGVGFPVGIVDKGTADLFTDIDRNSENKFRSKSFRRGHVQLFILNICAVIGFGFVENGGIFKMMFVASSILLLATISIIRFSILGLADLPNSLVDEREKSLRDSIFMKSYKYLSFSMAYLLAALVLWGESVTNHQIIVGSIVFLAIAVALPSAIIAWTEEDI